MNIDDIRKAYLSVCLGLLGSQCVSMRGRGASQKVYSFIKSCKALIHRRRGHLTRILLRFRGIKGFARHSEAT